MVPSLGPRIPGIEGMRALAASSIVVFHVWRWSSPDSRPFSFGSVTGLFPDLSFGVTLFFTLSGFLLYRPFVSRLLRSEERPSLVRYLSNRALRIIPAYWIILLISALVLRTVFTRGSGGELGVGAITDPGLLLRNLLFVQNFDADTVLTGIGPAWSLAVEVVFYLMLPALAAFSWLLARRAHTRARRRLAALAPALLLLIVGLAGKAAAALVVHDGAFGGWRADWGGVLERSFLVHADLFSFGMALAVLHVDAEDGFFRLARRGRVAVALSALLAYATVAKATTWEQLTHSPYNTLMALACALLLALVVLPRPQATPSRLVRFLETRPLVVVGTVSYSVFLWHEPLIRWLHQHDIVVGGMIGFFVNLSLVGLITLVLSVLSYRYVEAPALRHKTKSARSVAAEPAAAAP